MKPHGNTIYPKRIERKIQHSKEEEVEISIQAAKACKIITLYLKKFKPEAIKRALAASGVLLS